jgi:hypothetical protein
MKFSPNAKTVQLYTGLTVGEIQEKLNDIVQAPDVFGKAEKEYYGTITSDEFKITRTQGANRSSFYPVIKGKITSAGEQRIITISFRVHKLFRVLFWFPVANFILMLVNIAYNTLTGTDPKNAGWEYFLTVLASGPVFMLIIMLLPRLFGFFTSTSNTIVQFKKIWKAEDVIDS